MNSVSDTSGSVRRRARVATLLIISLVSGAGFLLVASSAAALSKGTLSGAITDASGPVAGAHVIATGANNNLADATTDSSGHYELEAWPDTYRVSAYPPHGSSDGFASQPGIVVNEGASSVANLSLPASRGSGHVSGNAFYADHSADAGVEVSVFEVRLESGIVNNALVYTDEAGSWDAGSLPSGLYRLSYSVLGGGSNPVYPESHSLGSELIVVEAGTNQVFSKELSGQKPLSSLIVNVTSAEGWAANRGNIHLEVVGGGLTGDTEFGRGSFRFPALPTGTYNLSATGDYNEDDGTGTGSVSVTDGHLTTTSIQLPAKPVPPGTTAQREQQELAWLNAQRAQWGLPTGLVSVPIWSQACAAHDAYGARNKVLEHPEDASKPGHSIGGQWAGEHSILAGGGGWAPEDNPWNDAPIHLNQLMTPALSAVGIDDSNNYECVTTWPGMLRSGEPGTIYTYPGSGTIGIPPAEFASELPTTPNKALGVPDLAGRQLFVYENGTETYTQGFSPIHVLSASLTSPSGPVAIKVADNESEIGGYLTGAIIVPVQPLQPFTTYTATVTLAASPSHRESWRLPQVTHSWTFTTGQPNPNGNWREYHTDNKRHKVRHHPTLKLRRRGNHMVVIGVYFKPRKRVVLRRQPGNQLIRRLKVGAKGKFQVPLKWGHRPVLIVTAKQGKKTVKVRMKATGHDHQPGLKHGRARPIL